jgi:hypothetical protein
VVVAGCPDGGRRRTGGGRIQRGPVRVRLMLSAVAPAAG